MTSQFLPLYKDFPTDDARNLERQLVNSYQSIANTLNNRTISTFETNAILNGERWFPLGNTPKMRDGNRLVVQVSDSTLTISHNISMINQVTRLYGAFYDGTYWWPLPYVDVANATNQINVKVSPTQIIVTKGGGSPPSISNGIVVLEWL